jgi:hypothetical protein
MHVDLLEHPDHVSASSNHYVLNIIDDFSFFCWSIPLNTKFDAFTVLQAWELAQEAETGLCVGTLRSDNRELKHTDLRDWLATHGTQHQFTTPHASAQNSCIERVHHTLMGKACAMRSYAKVPVNRWDKFLLTACYLINHTLIKSPSNHTPYKRWYGHPSNLSHLREVGCCAFVLVQNRHNAKVYNRSVECVLIGYSLDSKAYHCFHRASGKVFISYHVSFIESHQSVSEQIPTPPSTVLSTPPTPLSSTSDVAPLPLVPTTSPTPSPLPPRRSFLVSQPTEKHAAAIGISYIPAIQCAVLAAINTAEHQTPPNLTPPSSSDGDNDDVGI